MDDQTVFGDHVIRGTVWTVKQKRWSETMALAIDKNNLRWLIERARCGASIYEK